MTPAPDLVVRGGTVLDGTGGPAVEADVRISRGRIASIGRHPSPEDATEIDATGLFVAPGFIDIHSHSDFTMLLVDPRAVSAVSQGVTLEVVGNCGYGCAPIVDPDLAREAIYGFRCTTWASTTSRSVGGASRAISSGWRRPGPPST